MKHAQLTIASLLSAAALLLPACDRNPSAWKTPNMTALSPRLQPLFEKTKTVCFGRFFIEVPQTAEVIWGPAQVPFTTWLEKGKAGELQQLVAETETKLKAEPRFPTSKKLSLYFETLDGVLPGMKHVVSQENFNSTGMLRINALAAVGSDLLQMQARPLDEDMNSTISELNDMARRLRPRAETEAPTEPGTCIAHAFLPDAPDTKPEQINEHIRVGFRLQEFGDVHLAIYLGPANADANLSWSLDRQLKETEDDARKAGKPNPFKSLTVFRRDKREIHAWKDGFEYLTRTPEEEESRAHHDFWMKFSGAAGNVLEPYADIAFKTGVDRDLAGAVKPSITDEEAIALWDKLTGSIRVRPTSTKTSEAPAPKALGEQAATGRICPQTGWWECVDELPFAQPRGVWLQEGQLMPRVVVWNSPNLWQRVNGGRTQGAQATMWRLAAYEAPLELPPPAAEGGSTDNNKDPTLTDTSS